jgi:hypothetical protein
MPSQFWIATHSNGLTCRVSHADVDARIKANRTEAHWHDRNTVTIGAWRFTRSA